jgi:hypothetical protein
MLGAPGFGAGGRGVGSTAGATRRNQGAFGIDANRVALDRTREEAASRGVEQRHAAPILAAGMGAAFARNDSARNRAWTRSDWARVLWSSKMAVPPASPRNQASDPAEPEVLAELRYAVTSLPERWVLPEVKVPESRPHDRASELFHDQLEAWIERSGRDALVARNLAVRWSEQKRRIGVDPDVCLIEPAPPERDEITSLCVWKPGHQVPRFALEIVSLNHPYKDYGEAPDKYAACGTEELVVFDPLLAGPRAGGGPHLLQLWRRDASGAFVRLYAGSRPARSTVLGAWLHVVDAGKRLRAADDEQGSEWWRTREEAAGESETAAREREQAAREREQAALRRIAELESEVDRLRR